MILSILKGLTEEWNYKTFTGNTWSGVSSLQYLGDNWAMQELITKINPDFIIETGTYRGGTSLFYATILAQISKDSEVISIDIEPLVEDAAKFNVFRERVEVINGDTLSPEVIEKIAKRVEGKRYLLRLMMNI